MYLSLFKKLTFFWTDPMINESEKTGAPVYPGYVLVGRDENNKRHFLFPVMEKSSECHCSLRAVAKESLLLPLEDDVSSRDACFMRFANIGLHPFNQLAALPGKVCVVGLGPVGNVACQTAQILGCDVLGVDLCEERLEAAKRCGVSNAALPSKLKDFGGQFDLVIDTVVNDATLSASAEILKPGGECSLVGIVKPGKLSAGELLQKIWTKKLVFRSGWEMLNPLKKGQGVFAKTSTEDNLSRALSWLKQGFYNFEPLVSSVIKPEGSSVKNAYLSLRDNPSKNMCVLIDWL